jgi:Metallo-peptidase family M12
MSLSSRGSAPLRRHRSRAGFWMLAAQCLAVIATGITPALAQQQGRRSELVLSNLPPRNSKAYRDLIGLAGKTANGQILPLSAAEVWSMPTPLIENVIRKGETLGVKMTRLGADWNEILKPPGAPMSMSSHQEEMMKAMESSKETMSVGMMTTPNAAVVEYALMKDSDPKVAIGKRPAAHIQKIMIPIKGKGTITVRRTKVEMRKDGCNWRGEIEGTGEPVALMWWKGGRFSGMFTYGGHMYSLKSMGGEVHAVVETDPGKMPPDHAAIPSHRAQSGADLKDDPLVARGEGDMMRPRDKSKLKDRQDAIGGEAPAKMGGSQETRQSAPKIRPLSASKRRAMARKKITIDLMVLYTPRVAAKYIEVQPDLVALAVEQGNESFDNSGLGNIGLRLVHTEQIDYDESGGEHFNHLYHMVDGEGVFAKVRKLRNEKRADIVALIVDDPSGCGLSTRVAADADEAYVVVHHACAALTYSLAHEVGHIIGARHDRALDSNMTPFPYGHGFVNGKKWRDIMSYKASCNGCPRQPVWSNPFVKFRGDRAGTIDTDNARVILEQAERVSKFR